MAQCILDELMVRSAAGVVVRGGTCRLPGHAFAAFTLPAPKKINCDLAACNTLAKFKPLQLELGF